MNTRAIDYGRPDFIKDASDTSGASTIESEAIKKVVRENWEAKAKGGDARLGVLNKHAEFLRRELKSTGSEAICMHNIAANSKRMSKGELQAYIKLIEALAIGYKTKFGLVFANLLMVGVTSVARDPRLAKKHFDHLLNGLDNRASTYNNLIEKEKLKADVLSLDLNRKESSILRFFKKREITNLRGAINRRRNRVVKLATKKGRYENLANTLKSMADPYSSKK